MSDDLLRQAITAIKSGDKVLGKKLLLQVLEQNSRNEFAWLWLSQCVTSHEQKLDCIKRTLEINPNNTTAQKELARLQTLSQIKAQPAPRAPALPKKKPVSKLFMFGVAAVFLAISCVCLYAFGLTLTMGSNNPSVSSGTPSASASEAYIICKDFVELLLVAPSTAKWPPFNSVRVQKFQDLPSAYRIIGYVDAQNSFGAQIRTNYVCEISYKGGGWTDMRNWELLNLKFDE